ncbi:MAG: hypothetical protein H6722_02850 [Sandaracinus sp.]|nr:hypothetical protein [Sandaracinus sp.]
MPLSELTAPTVLLGVGRFGAAVAERLAHEAAESLRDAHGDAPDADAWADAVRERGLELVRTRRDEDAEALATRVGERARALLAHARLAPRRDAPGRDGPTRLHVLVLAHLEEPAVRERLGADLAAIERRLLRELGPLFAAHRTHAARNLVLLPLVAMPHPAAAKDGADIAAKARELARSIAKTPSRERAIPQLFLVEDVSELTVLSEPELAQQVRNFASFVLYGLPALESGEALLYGREPHEPLATFACATAEIPRSKLRRYGTARVALEVLDAVVDAPRQDAELARIDVLEEVELAGLDAIDSSEGDVRALLERYAPTVERDDEPRWWTRGETLRERYGPDHGDASRDPAQPPPDVPMGWALERMQEIEKGWRLLQRRRFDDLVARERRAVEEARDRVLGQVKSFVDRTLWQRPDPEAFRRASELVALVARHVDDRLAEAVRERDAIAPPPAPSFDAFRDAHAELLDAARRKPDLGRLLVFGALAVAGFVSFGPELLVALADVLGVGQGDALDAVLRDQAPWTAFGLGTVFVIGTLAPRFRKAVRAVRERFHAMFAALEQTVVGANGSLLDYFRSRLRLARQVARVEALLALQATVRRDAERLALLDRAARRARADLKDELRRLGVVDDDPSGVLGAGDESLVEPLVGPEGGDRLRALLPSSERRTRVLDVLGTLATESGFAQRWREEVPFTDVAALRRATTEHAAPVIEWAPTATPEGADAVARQIATFVRRQARSLGVALGYRAHEARDTTGVSTFARGDAVVPRALVEPVRRALAEDGAAGRAVVTVHAGPEPDRAYYLVAHGDIAEAAVASLAVGEELRFEIEEGDDA